MRERAIALAEMLMDIEKELRDLRLWDAVPPSAAALASTEPFALDTLDFPQWLQFIFIPRLYFLIEQNADLPFKCSVAPMAAEYFRPLNLHSAPLINILLGVDQLLTR